MNYKVADLKLGAIGRQPSPDGARDARRQVAANGGRAQEKDVGLPLLHQFDGHPCLGQRAVGGQFRVLGQQYVVGAIVDNGF